MGDGCSTRTYEVAMRRRREIKLSEWAERQGMSLRTAQRKAARGDLPVPTRVDDSGKYMVFVDEGEFPRTISPEEVYRLLHVVLRRLDDIEQKVSETT